MVLICILAAAAIVFFLFLGAVEDITSVEEEKVTLNLASPIVVQRDIDGTPHWDASFNVNKITPRDSGLGWSDVRVVVKSNIGSVLLTTTRPLVDNPSAYDDASDGTVDVEVWFVDADGDGLLEASDTLKLTGLTADYEGAQFEVLRSGERIASSSMPTDFG